MIYAISGSQVYRLTKKAWERVLLSWARNGHRPEFADWQGVKPIGQLQRLDTWNLHDVEKALWALLSDGHSPAGKGEAHAMESDPTPAAPEPAGMYEVRPMEKGSLLEIVNTENGEIVASHLNKRQADDRMADLA